MNRTVQLLPEQGRRPEVGSSDGWRDLGSRLASQGCLAPWLFPQDSFQSRFTRMSILVPARLLELAVQSLLRDEALAIAALEELPRELFPPLFTAAFLGRHSNVLRAMVQAWPFPCLPLGALMREQLSHQETFKAVLDGLDDLLAQEVCTR